MLWCVFVYMIVDKHDIIHSILSLTLVYTSPLLRDAVKLLVTKSRVVAGLSTDMVKNTEENTFFILRNSLGMLFSTINRVVLSFLIYFCIICSGEMLDRLNTSAFMYETDISLSVDTMKTWALTLLLVGILSIGFVIIFVVKPVVWLVKGMQVVF